MTSWLHAFHVIGIILWMGGLFQLARHLGEHAELESQAAREAYASYESTTYYAGVLPGFLLTLATGVYLLLFNPSGVSFGTYMTGDAWGGTFHLKLLLVVVLIGIDQTVHYKMRQLHGDGEGSRAFFMAAHGIVALSFVVIVIVVQTRLLGAG